MPVLGPKYIERAVVGWLAFICEFVANVVVSCRDTRLFGK